MVALPRLVVAAPSTGQGKTTIATGLMAALRHHRGLKVSGHKVGPDYIDPGYHALATGRPGRNLDPHLVGENLVAPLLLHGAAGADVAVVEGVMGLYDGRLGTDGFASTAHVATLTASPVILVVDVARMSRTAGAVAAGMAAYDPTVRIAGVLLNRAGSARNVAEIARSMERAGLPVLGAIPHDETLAAPSRHLGLVPVAERDASARMIERLGEQVAAHVDLDAVLEIARSAPSLDGLAWSPAPGRHTDGGDGSTVRMTSRPTPPSRPLVAMAGGRAFTFRYPETEELLRAAGCEVVTFDPLTDTALPPGTAGLYLGGGFPEVYASELASNRALLGDLRAAVLDGLPTVAECAGLLYLAESLDGVPMAGVLPTTAAMSPRLTLRYPVATAPADSLLTRAGEQATGHEFHRTTAGVGAEPAWVIDGQPTGFASESLHASYLHVHWAGHPHLAERFADAVHAAAPHVPPAPTRVTARLVEPVVPVTDPLRHHGDTEATAGLLDLAVNVYDGPRPAWLARALHAALDDTAYPDARPARAAIAAHHQRPVEEVLPTAGAAEAFSLVARLRPWRRPVVVHPQFTEPHAALEQAGHVVTAVLCREDDGFTLDVAAVPDDADLVMVGNPTNPTGVLHPATTIAKLCRPGRLVVVDEAFMDGVPGEPETLAAERREGLLVIRSLTKLWSIPGVRAGYLLGDAETVAALAALQTPWAVSAPALAAAVACTDPAAQDEAQRRAEDLAAWRDGLQQGLRDRGVEHVASDAPFVLARLGVGVREALREHGIAVRRADTFPGLDSSWARIAARPPAATARLFTALDQIALDQTRLR